MKKTCLLFICTWLLAMATYAQKPVTITGTIPSLPDGTEIFVSDYATYSRTTVDDAIAKCPVKDGKFSFKLTIKEPRQIVVWVERPHSNKPIVVVPGDNITINADKPHMLFQADVKGAKTDEAFAKIRELPSAGHLSERLHETTHQAEHEHVLRSVAGVCLVGLLAGL